MTLVCSVCGEKTLKEVKGEVIFNGKVRKNCSSIFCNCGNWEQVKYLDQSKQEQVQNPGIEMRELLDKITIKDRTIATHEQDLASVYAQLDQKIKELERANQELQKYQNETEQPTNLTRQKR